MTYQEKKGLVNIFSSLLITSIYSYFIYQKHINGEINLANDYGAWGKVFLIFIGVSIIARIIIYIVFHILNAIATKEEKVPIVDERDKLIELKSSRNGHYSFMIGIIIGFGLMTIYSSPVYLFLSFVVFGLVSEIAENISHIIYHRKGI